MDRWQRSHRIIGANAPSWLTFELYRPYFDGAASPITPVQARAAVVAAARFAARTPAAAQHAMVMPASFRQLLTEESRLSAYRVLEPDRLPDELASPAWRSMASVYATRDDLDATDRIGLVQWLSAACLPDAALAVADRDATVEECRDELTAMAQYGRAQALMQREGVTDATRAAFAPLVAEPVATIAHLSASGVWSYLLARNTADPSQAPAHAARARRIFGELDLPPFEYAVWQARIPLREVTLAERGGDLDRAWDLIEEARVRYAEVRPRDGVEESVAVELWRRILDRRVEIAVKRDDRDAEDWTIAEGVRIDPYDVKIRMQQAQAAERRGDAIAARDAYLLASRLGPFGTAYALLHAAKYAGGEASRVFAERAYRVAPRSQQTRAALLDACRHDGDTRSADAIAGGGNWHQVMYGAYFNLGPSASPALYAQNPWFAYGFAKEGAYPALDVQRIMPPAFRANLFHEAGRPEFDIRRPSELAPELRTPAWEQLCDWIASFPGDDPHRRLLTCKVLYHLGLRQQLFELLPERPASSLHDPHEFNQYVLRELAAYAELAGRRKPSSPQFRLELIDQPECPLFLRFTGATFAVTYAGRDSKSIPDAEKWRARAEELMPQVLSDPAYTEFDRLMLQSRYYRAVGFLPFLQGDIPGLLEDMGKAETFARAIVATTPWQDHLRRENLHACMESRAKEALRLRDPELAHKRLKEALALDPYHPLSTIELAESLAQQGKYADAAAYYQRAARLGPYGTALAYNMAGECLRKAGDDALAEDCYLQALRVDPYAVSAARGWQKTAGPALAQLAGEYAAGLQAWGESRRKAKA